MVSNALRCDPTQYGYVLASNAINFYFSACIFRIHFNTYTGAIITNDYIPSFAIHFERIYSHWPISTHKLFMMGNSILVFCVRPLFPLAAEFCLKSVTNVKNAAGVIAQKTNGTIPNLTHTNPSNAKFELSVLPECHWRR